MDIILASQSPRRRELLERMGITRFKTVSPDIDERAFDGLPPEELVRRLSAEKAGAVADRVGDGAIIIAADTVVALDGTVLGKPGDGFTQLLGTTAYGKLGFTAVFVGTALGAADIALKYCQEKLHRGKSITKFPTTQLRLSTMLTYAHTAELLLLEAADYCDHNHFEPDDIPTMRAVQARTAQAKGYAAETATKVATMAVNAMGAYGVCDEYQAERFLRDAAVAPNIEGSGDIQYLIHGMFVAANGNTN